MIQLVPMSRVVELTLQHPEVQAMIAMAAEAALALMTLLLARGVLAAVRRKRPARRWRRAWLSAFARSRTP